MTTNAAATTTSISSSTEKQEEIPTLSNYLNSLSDLWKETTTKEANNNKIFNVIIGNEAGDADSIISALTLSYTKDVIIGNNNDKYRNLPVVSILRDDIQLRRDVTLLLEMAGIVNKDEFIYLDDIISFEKNNNDFVLTLVDHNKVRSDSNIDNKKVIEIVDHHQDEHFHEDSCLNRQVEFDDTTKQALVGSTCTLVTEKIMSSAITHDGKIVVDGQLGFVLLGVILLDTMNMCPIAKKGTIRDQNAIQFLQTNTNWKALLLESNNQNLSDLFTSSSSKLLSINITKFYETLRDSKFDISFWNSLSVRDALRMDYKRFESSGNNNDKVFGMSSVLQVDVTLKEDFQKQAESYMMNDAKVDLLFILTLVINNGELKRELAILGTNKTLVSNVCNFLLRHESTAFLNISTIKENNGKEDDDDGHLKVVKLQQGNPKGSRKQVAPLLLSFFSDNN